MNSKGRVGKIRNLSVSGEITLLSIQRFHCQSPELLALLVVSTIWIII